MRLDFVDRAEADQKFCVMMESLRRAKTRMINKLMEIVCRLRKKVFEKIMSRRLETAIWAA